jgi:hypothetical protein
MKHLTVTSAQCKMLFSIEIYYQRCSYSGVSGVATPVSREKGGKMNTLDKKKRIFCNQVLNY